MVSTPQLVGAATVGGRRRRLLVGLALFPILVLGLVGCSHHPVAFFGLPCRATAATETYGLDTDQAANAATIAAVGKRLGLPDHAVTIALATALQESKLRNLDYGDHDSLGLFQQRPSQGWGTPAQIMTPRFAATAFFTHLAKVDNWESVPVTDAAQKVQRSAGGYAYAQWEPEARVVAQALTGELPAAFTCRITSPTAPAAASADLSAELLADLGPPALGVALGPARGWQVASWLIAHAGRYGVTTVTFNGWRWSGNSGVWKARPPVSNTVEINR